jgi:hypothetical protein
MHNKLMRTTITLSDESREFASYYARVRGITLSAAIDELIRKADPTSPNPEPEIRYSEIGLPLLPKSGKVLTCEMVKKLAEDEFDPAKFA